MPETLTQPNWLEAREVGSALLRANLDNEAVPITLVDDTLTKGYQSGIEPVLWHMAAVCDIAYSAEYSRASRDAAEATHALYLDDHRARLSEDAALVQALLTEQPGLLGYEHAHERRPRSIRPIRSASIVTPTFGRKGAKLLVLHDNESQIPTNVRHKLWCDTAQLSEVAQQAIRQAVL